MNKYNQQQQQTLTTIKKKIIDNNREKNDENIDNIKEVRVYKWKAPKKQNTSAASFPTEPSKYATDSFAKAGTGESILDSLPNDVLQDVILKYWHNNHEYKYSGQQSNETAGNNDEAMQEYREHENAATYDENYTTTYE